MTSPITATETGLERLDPDEPGISDEESRRRRIERNKPLIALLDQWIAEGENATEEERQRAVDEWEEFFRDFEPVRFREYHHET
jgi:hypothetical protein